jgi:two-component system chemotaxis response regulator CheB
MKIRVLVVDDSSFFRRRVSEILNNDANIEVIATANNGQEAVEKALQLKPSVITMDIEMPVLDGISAVKKIMQQQPTPILMFSSLTHDGARATLDALDAGALDFLPKKFEDIARDKEEATKILQQKVREIGRRRVFSPRVLRTSQTTPTGVKSFSSSAPSNSLTRQTNRASESIKEQATPRSLQPSRGPKASGKKYKLLTIGCSTGGPVALQKVLTRLPASFPHPILLIQHMPGAFTPAFAQRLNTLCGITVKEAENGEQLKPGVAYLAPGGQQMMVEARRGVQRLKVFQDESARVTYKPSVDITFGSAAKCFGDSVLAIVLTGMGADGRNGAKLLKQAGSKIWAQDEASCVVYGMPQAIASAGLNEKDIALDEIATHINTEIGCG